MKKIAYMVRTSHTVKDVLTGKSELLEAIPGLNHNTLTAIALLLHWDSYNCMVTHSNNNGLNAEENCIEFASSFANHPEDEFYDNDRDILVSVDRVTPFDAEESAHLKAVYSRLNNELYSDYADDILAKTYEFLSAISFTPARLAYTQISNPVIAKTVQFFGEYIDAGKTEYDPGWLADLNNALA